jgi:hypothetical protein
LRPFGIEPQHAAVGHAPGGLEQRRVGPGVELEAAGGVGEGEDQVGLAALGLAVAAGLQLAVDGGGQRRFARLFLEGGDGQEVHRESIAGSPGLSRTDGRGLSA